MTWIESLQKANFPTPTLLIDFESYFDQDYHLGKDKKALSTIEYVTDGRFEFTGLGIQAFNHPLADRGPIFIEGPMIKRAIVSLKKQFGIGYHNCTVVAENCRFDITILAHHFGIFPPYTIDIQDLTRYYDSRMSQKLKDVAALLGLKAKGDTKRFKGLHWQDMDAETRRALKEYTIGDVEIEATLLQKFLPMITDPKFELDLARHTLNLYLKPELVLDFNRATMLACDMEAEVDKIIESVKGYWPPGTEESYIKKILRGRKEFPKMLDRALGDDPLPMKRGKNGPIPAFAKTDEACQHLLGHENKKVRDLVLARLGITSWPSHAKRVNSLIKQSRCSDGKTRVPLKYHGCHTGRWSGCECVTGEHEVLTPSGWLPIGKWNPKKTPIAQWDGGSIEFVQGIKGEYEYDGPLCHLRGANKSLSCTPNHRIVRWSGKGHWGEQLAWEHPNGYIPCSGRLKREITFSEDETRLIVATQADGWFRQTTSGKHYLQFRFTKSRKIKRLLCILQRLGLSHTVYDCGERGKNINLGVGGTPTWLYPGIKRKFPDGVNPTILINELPYWDGSLNKKGNAFSYTTNCKELAEQVQIIAITSGFCASLVEYTAQSGNMHYRLNISPRQRLWIGRHNSWENSQGFKGKVYCPAVPSGMWVVRHKGCVSITGNSINLQNLGGKGRGKPIHPLIAAVRGCLMAPEGFVLAIADSAQIEARELAWLSGQNDLVEGFASGEDIYSKFATRLFGERVWKPASDDDSPEAKMASIRRGFGKDAILGAGYGLGANTFYLRCRQNDTLRPLFDSGQYDWDFIDRLIKTYRSVYAKIPNFWRQIEKCFRFPIKYPHETTEYKLNDRVMLRFRMDNSTLIMTLPSGREMFYHRARLADKDQIKYLHGKLWGGAITENIIQAICRDLLGYWILGCERAGIHIVHHAHDEIIGCVDDSVSATRLSEMIDIMSVGPAWAEGLPLAAEGELSERYKK